jgi:hypothetical protein
VSHTALTSRLGNFQPCKALGLKNENDWAHSEVATVSAKNNSKYLFENDSCFIIRKSLYLLLLPSSNPRHD